MLPYLFNAIRRDLTVDRGERGPGRNYVTSLVFRERELARRFIEQKRDYQAGRRWLYI